jgi:polyisoprenoid-binding protein YceI
VRHFPFQEFRGEFTNIVGGLAFPSDPAQYGQALLLIHTSSLKSDNTALVPLVKGSNFMDTANYPEFLFVGRRVEWLNAVQAHIYGELTLRGRTLPVIFNVEIDVLDDTNGNRADRIRLRGTSHVSRFKFDMRSHRFFVSDTIKLCLAVELVLWGS